MTKVRALERGRRVRSSPMLIVRREHGRVRPGPRALRARAHESLEHLVVVDMFLTETAEARRASCCPRPRRGPRPTACTRTPSAARSACAPPCRRRATREPDWWIVAGYRQAHGPRRFRLAVAQATSSTSSARSPRSTSRPRLGPRIGTRAATTGPCPKAGHPGTPVLHVGTFPRGKRPVHAAPSYRDPAEVIDDEYPVWLTTGRRLAHYHTRTMTGRAAAQRVARARGARRGAPRRRA
jgi:formate dehydrogenase major subunit